jgi:hypothetical protein
MAITLHNTHRTRSKTATVVHQWLLVAFLVLGTTALGQDSGNPQPSSDSNWGILVGLLVFVGIPLATCIYAVRGAYKLTFVFYYNKLDLIASTATPFVGMFLAIFAGGDAGVWIVISAYAAVLIWNFVAGFRFNPENKFGAFCVGASRGIIGVLIPLIMVIKFIYRGTAKRQGESAWSHAVRNEVESIRSLAFVALLGWFLKSLVNGEDVMYWREQMHSSSAKQQSKTAASETETEYADAGGDAPRGEGVRPVEAPESPYVVLGIAESASESEIKKHYRDLMLRFHPDRTAGLGKDLRGLAEEMAKRVTVAYNQIKDERRFA